KNLQTPLFSLLCCTHFLFRSKGVKKERKFSASISDDRQSMIGTEYEQTPNLIPTQKQLSKFLDRCIGKMGGRDCVLWKDEFRTMEEQKKKRDRFSIGG